MSETVMREKGHSWFAILFVGTGHPTYSYSHLKVEDLKFSGKVECDVFYKSDSNRKRRIMSNWIFQGLIA
jgi:hypothetical protein